MPHGTIRATVLIETILAAFEMDEILYELRDHSAGLNGGRWDYIFSFIKKLRQRHRDSCCPIAAQVTMDGAVPARLLASCSSRPATAAARSRWAAWPRSSRHARRRR